MPPENLLKRRLPRYASTSKSSQPSGRCGFALFASLALTLFLEIFAKFFQKNFIMNNDKAHERRAENSEARALCDGAHEAQLPLRGDGRGLNTSGRGRKIWGYAAGIITGVTYGMNPLFAMPILKAGVSVDTVLFVRYAVAVLVLAGLILASRKSFAVSRRQAGWLTLLGVLYSCSSLGLFLAYNHIPSGIATTIVFLYPTLVALIMVFLKVYPTWQTWVSIAVTFIAILFLCNYDSSQPVRWEGLVLAFLSALSYAFFIVLINQKRCLRELPNDVLTFYALGVGCIVFCAVAVIGSHTGDISMLTDFGILNSHASMWINLVLLAVIPTVISTATLAASTKIIGAAKASVMGVFEPLTAILIGTLVFGEKMSWNIAIGILLSIFAICFMIISPGKKKAAR